MAGKSHSQKVVLGKFIKRHHAETLPGGNAAFCWVGFGQIFGKILVQCIRFFIGHLLHTISFIGKIKYLLGSLLGTNLRHTWITTP
jgi:hypothetical protein